jgi:hypothetical protein
MKSTGRQPLHDRQKNSGHRLHLSRSCVSEARRWIALSDGTAIDLARPHPPIAVASHTRIATVSRTPTVDPWRNRHRHCGFTSYIGSENDETSSYSPRRKRSRHPRRFRSKPRRGDRFGKQCERKSGGPVNRLQLRPPAPLAQPPPPPRTPALAPRLFPAVLRKPWLLWGSILLQRPTGRHLRIRWRLARGRMAPSPSSLAAT